jgi:succinate dehydrogenase/fumarate reductase flavoprotein subunit
MAQIIVVGGGLAGLSAAHTILERGGNVLLLDKQGSVRVLSHPCPC